MDTMIGNRLSELRSMTGESQDQVADASDISRVSYTRYESSQREPKASAAVRLARHFGVTVEYLCGYEDSSVSKSAPLDQNTKKLLEIFCMLNEQGKNWILDCAYVARENPQFAKESLQNAAT